MDSKIALGALAFGNLLVLALLLAYRRMREDPAIRYHVKSQAYAVLSYPMAVARLVIPGMLFPILNSIFLMLATFYEALALATLADLKLPRIRRFNRIALYVGIPLYLLSVILVWPAYVRATIVTFICAFVVFLPAVGILRVRDGSRLRTLLGVLFCFMILAFAIRIADAIRLGSDFAVFNYSLGEYAMLAAFFVYLILGGAGIILLAKEKSDIRLEKLAYHDEPTGVLNRNGFILEAEKRIEKTVYDNCPFTMLLVDVDDLDLVNERDGYEAGNRAILRVAEILGDEVPEKGLVGRLGGDEFMAFLPGMGEDAAKAAMERLNSRIAERDEGETGCTVSIGAVSYESPAGRGLSFAYLYPSCIEAMKKARARGPGRGFSSLT